MGSVSGVVSKKNEDVFERLMELLFDLRHRGKDSFGVMVNSQTKISFSLQSLRKTFIKGSIGIAHSRLEITGKQPQPLTFGNSSGIIFNGEIYNFFEFSSSGSDSVFVRDFFEKELKNNSVEFAVKKFMSKANGEYAVAVFHNKKIFVFRDLFGIKPVWFGENDSFIAFSSEPKPLKKMNINFPLPLPPGSLLVLSEKGVQVKKVFSFDLMKKSCSKKASFSELKKSFFESVSLRSRNLEKTGVFFSGGVDSTLIAKAVSSFVPKTELFTAGMQDSHDIVSAEKAAEELGLKLHLRIIEEHELKDLSLKALSVLSFFDEMQLQLAVPEYAVCGLASKNGMKVMFSGQGSDEIFGGYSNYTKVLSSNASVSDAIWHSVLNLWSRNFYREDIISMNFSLEHRLPFLDKNLVCTAMKIPVKQKIFGPKDKLRKRILRKLALDSGISKEISFKPKKALQYGSGVSRHLTKLF
ncbi:MAG: asparagine synthase-related protein [archaeon]